MTRAVCDVRNARSKRVLWAFALLALTGLATGAESVPASGAPPERVVREAAEAIERGAPSEAIEKLELLADQGFVHPDASFNRGVAYLERARSATAASGDRGRAILAFTEAERMRPSDVEARSALATAQSELDKQRARQGVSTSLDSPPLSHLVVELLSENTWAFLALGASGLTTLGLLLLALTRRSAAEGKPSATRLSGAVLASVGGLVLVATGSGAAYARHERQSSHPAVVVVPTTRPLDEAGRPARGTGPSEGALVNVLENRGQLALVQAGSTQLWLRQSDVQELRTVATAAQGAPQR